MHVVLAVVSDPKSRTQDEDKKNLLKLYAPMSTYTHHPSPHVGLLLRLAAGSARTEARSSKSRKTSRGFWSSMTAQRPVRPLPLTDPTPAHNINRSVLRDVWMYGRAIAYDVKAIMKKDYHDVIRSRWINECIAAGSRYSVPLTKK